MTDSLASSLASLPERKKRAILESLTREERARLEYLWPFWARPKQLSPPGGWRTWLICAGRAFGKTRSGAEWVREQVEQRRCGRVALVGATAADARDVIVEGESGLLAVSPPGSRPVYEPSKRRLTWPNGAIATTYSADEPDRLRGPQHDGGWADELAAWRYPEAWDQLQFGLRLGDNPRLVVTTTPRPTPIVRALIASATTHVTRGSTYENRANLPDVFFEKIIARYEGTRLGRQELLAEILDDNPGAIFQQADIEKGRVRHHPLLVRVIVAIDPAISKTEDSDETGIVVVGLGVDLHAYVLADLSGKYTPAEWGRKAIHAFRTMQADRIVAEVNQGGDLVKANLTAVDPRVPFKPVRASRGKRVRAEPVAALYEQGRVHHVGVFAALEDQMVAWDPVTTPYESPDRMDALVWAITELLLEAQPARRNFENLPPG
jgi:phage terminase large subunit-like protein